MARSEVTWKLSPIAAARPVDGPVEGLGHVVGVHVVQRLEPQVRQEHPLARGQTLEHVQVQVAGRVDRQPAGADDVARVSTVAGMPPRGPRPAAAPRSPPSDAVVAERPARRVLARRHLAAGAVHPDRPAVEQVADEPRSAATSCRAESSSKQIRSITTSGRSAGDPLPEGARGVLGLAVGVTCSTAREAPGRRRRARSRPGSGPPPRARAATSRGTR